eukprot:scaffold97093_cov26-Tisochrysis_lutea.AAC.2
MHRISSATSRLWLGCDFLGPPSLEGGGLFHELQLKAVLYERANKRGEPFRPHFNSAEGCYSHVVTSNAALRVKYANKVSFAYWRHHLVDSGSNCTVRRYTTNGLRWERNAASWLGESLSLSQPPPRTHADDCRLHLCAGGREGDGTAGGMVGRRRDSSPPPPPAEVETPCDPFAEAPTRVDESLRGNQRAVGELIPIDLHSNCSEWVERRYRVCADVTGAWAHEKDAAGATDGWNFFFLHGKWFRQRFTASHAPGVVEGALFHFQVWKRTYKKQEAPVPIPRVGEGGAFVFSKEGFRRAHPSGVGVALAGGLGGWGHELEVPLDPLTGLLSSPRRDAFADAIADLDTSLASEQW